MTDPALEHLCDLQVDTEEWILPRCTCGWCFPPVRFANVAIDVLMEHAYEMGARR